MDKITGILVDAEGCTAAPATIEKSLAGYYTALNCDCIDLVSRKIGGVKYDIVCDDEGLLKAHPRVSAISKDGQPMLVGNLFIVKFDGQDDVRSLTEEEQAHVLKHVRKARLGIRPCVVIHPCDY